VSTRTLCVLWIIFPAVVALGQQANPASSLPAANPSQADCAGFVATNKVPSDIIVLDGADNDLESSLRQFTLGDSIYLSSRQQGNFSVGEEFAIVRPAKELFRTTRYRHEHWSLRALGTPYEDAGRAKVTRVTPEGAVADVSFACGPIYPGDIAVLYQPRVVPGYAPEELDRFALANGKMQGTITAARNNFASLATGDIVYLDLGEKQGATVGQRYRVYYTLRRPSPSAVFVYPPEPRETIGEVVVLSTQEKSSTAIIVNCTRDINVGYGVELE